VNGALIVALMMEIRIVSQKRKQHRQKPRFGMVWNVPKMKRMQFVLESIFAENLNQIKLHGVKIYD